MTSAQQLLVVDDEPVNLEIITEFLSDSGFKVVTETCSPRAWDCLLAAPTAYDIVLLDWVMPELDGLALLKQIKAHPQLAGIPVIMQTANGEKNRIAEAIAAGAYYFLTKPLDPDELTAIVKGASDDMARIRNLQNELRRERQSMRKLRHGMFEIRTLSEAQDLGVLLANACLEPGKAVVGLNELLVNAVEHGNLGITYEEKSQLKQSDTWLEEIERRLNSRDYMDRTVLVDFARRDGGIDVTITDQGQGFDWSRYLDFDPARAFDSHGRGIAMSKLVSFESIQYHGVGNSVTVRMAEHSQA